MLDSYGRDITYMRISVTEQCNLSCRYCKAAENTCQKSDVGLLTDDEIITAVQAAASLGITKLRFTGGEPLLEAEHCLCLPPGIPGAGNSGNMPYNKRDFTPRAGKTLAGGRRKPGQYQSGYLESG